MGEFPERVDGLVFGVAAGLGFAIAESVVRFSSVLSDLPLHSQPGNWTYTLITVAVLLPILHGSATGAIAGALWHVKGSALGLRTWAIIALAAAAHVGFILGSQMLNDRKFSQLTILAWQTLIVGALLLVVRYMLHEALLEEGVDLGFEQRACPNCHHHVFVMRFCPRCGKAMAATAGRPARSSVQPRAAEAASGTEVR
jgi:RsiW-degrading membrane proteinase PrsW (M82 family)